MYYKLLTPNKEYKEGINEDKDYPFIEGILFDDEKSVLKNCFYCDRIAEVIIPEGEAIDVYHNQYMSLKVILRSIKYLWDIETIKYLINSGIDIMEEESNLLSEASRNNKFEVVKYIIENDLYTQKQLDTALHYAIYHNCLEISKYLLEKGGNITNDNWDNKNLLSYSIRDKHFEMTHLLVETGFNINAGDTKPIVEAAKYGYLDIVAYLIGHNADIHIDNEMALCSAIVNRHKDIVIFLIENGADVDALKKVPFSGDFSLFFSLPLIWISGISSVLNRQGIQLHTYFLKSMVDYINIKMLIFHNFCLFLMIGLLLYSPDALVMRRIGGCFALFSAFTNLTRTFLSYRSDAPEYFPYYFLKSLVYICLCINFPLQNLFCNIVLFVLIMTYLAYFITEFSYYNHGI